VGTPDVSTTARPKEGWDGIGLEVLRSGLLGICEEMLAALVRSGRSPSLRERRDCSTSIYDATGEMIVQAEHIPVHLGVMPLALRKILELFPPESLRPGDCIITNDPHGLCNHLPDIIAAGPLFIDGHLVGMASSMAHHNDVGGMAPRSMSAEAREVFQEGLILPPAQLVSEGRLNVDLLRIVTANSRTAAEVGNDLKAQVATVALAQSRLTEICRRYGREAFVEGVALLIDRSELAIRRRLQELPDGRWSGESSADDGEHEYPIRVSLEILGSDLFIDFEGTAGQSTGPYNATFANTSAAVMTFLRGVVGADLPASAGTFRPLHINAPLGSIVNPRFPAAVSATTQVSYHTYEALMRAWATVDVEAVVADSGGGGVYSWGGGNPRTGELYGYGEALGGGGGASAGLRGEDCVMPPVANLRDTNAEALEARFPVRVEHYGLLRGSGGIGAAPGGRGFRRTIRMLAPATWSFQVSMSRRAPKGIAGGGPGRTTHCTIARGDGRTETVAQFCNKELLAGDAVIIETAGGGGYGSPAGSSGEDRAFGDGNGDRMKS
jgi:N-methylhydantoinase B